MKIYLTHVALVCAVPAASAFSTPVSKTFVRQNNVVLFSSPNEYLSTMQTSTSNEQPPPVAARAAPQEITTDGLDQRLNKLASMEKVLDRRLNDLARKEKVLEDRLSSLSTSERVMSRPSYRSGGVSDQRRFDDQRYGSAFDRYNSRRGGDYPLPRSTTALVKSINEIWDNSNPTTVQGGSLRTWAFANPAVKRVHVLLKTDGRPLDADVELWNGPDNTPHKMKVYVEDGGLRTFSTFIETPRSPNTVCIKNTGQLEFPLYGVVGVDRIAGDQFLDTINRGRGEIIQGGAIRTYAFDPYVDSVAVMIRTDGRPLNARIELLQGPNNNKQVLAVYTEDGLDRPFMAVIQTPGTGNVVRVVNTAPVEFPVHATVLEHEVGGYANSNDPYWNDGIQIGSSW